MFRAFMKVTALLGIVLAVLSPLAAEAKGKAYGDGVKRPVATPIEKVLANPAKWVGQDVRIDGIVTDVCPKAGCWLEISDEKSGKAIRFKVEDGEIVFPMSAKGHKASAEGTFEEVIMSPAERKEHPSHPIYRIRATGALIN